MLIQGLSRKDFMQTGLSRKDFPFTYLGVPIFYGRSKAIYFEPLVNKIRNALEGWKSKLLSFGGRITLIQSVLSSYPIYTLASAVVPKSILQRMERMMAQFLWDVKGENRTQWVSWRSVCKPMEDGGLGIRGLAQIQAGLHAKLLWMILTGKSIWAHIMRAKYFAGMQLVIPPTASPLWRSVASHFEALNADSRWIIGDGSRSFWLDNWIGERLIGPHPVDANLTVAQGLENFESLKYLIPARLHATI